MPLPATIAGFWPAITRRIAASFDACPTGLVQRNGEDY
jgi:hypothetical protein